MNQSSNELSQREGPRMQLFQEPGLSAERAGLTLNKERLWPVTKAGARRDPAAQAGLGWAEALVGRHSG